MTHATTMFLLGLLLLAASGSLSDLETCTAQGDAEQIDGLKLLSIKANQQNSEQHQLQSIQHHGAGTSIAAENRKIYTYWDMGNDPRPIIALNVQTWLKHAPPDTEIVLVNESNFRSLVPDAPEEFFRVPYAQGKSDIFRAALLYHHGGLYLDSDFIVMKPLSTIFAKLEEGWDVVTYSNDDPNLKTGECRDFSSNFMAARKGNVVSGTWWENIKFKLTRTCDTNSQPKACCHMAFWADDDGLHDDYDCNIPWGHLEVIKNPERDNDKPTWRSPPSDMSKKLAEAIGPSADAVLARIERGNAELKPLPEHARIFCFQGSESFAPLLNGFIYWQKWDAKSRATSTDLAQDNSGQYDLNFQCQEVGNGDLKCDKGADRALPNFFGRIAHHLYASMKVYDKPTREATLASDWLAAELIRRSLGEAL